MSRNRWIAVAIAALSLTGCDGDWDRKAGERALGVVNGAVRLTGAIFTTTEDGTIVNENHFECKEDVYLDGGPRDNAPSTSAALPEGDYYFQVTSPNGATLLSSDDIDCRSFHIDEDGLIDDNDPDGDGCGHEVGLDDDHDALTIQLFPFDTTPNPGGVYKVWVTRVEDYDPVAAARTHGFIPSRSKTDNFKAGECEKENGEIKACKYRDRNADGYLDGGDSPLPNWPITLEYPDATTEVRYTDATGCVIFDDLEPGDYRVFEETFVFGSFTWTPTGPVSVDVTLESGETEHVDFFNICICNYDTNRDCPSDYFVKHNDQECPPPEPPIY